jgi:magnesium-transporting ATPase (P-type)
MATVHTIPVRPTSTTLSLSTRARSNTFDIHDFLSFAGTANSSDNYRDSHGNQSEKRSDYYYYQNIIFIKGAPEKIIDFCKPSSLSSAATATYNTDRIKWENTARNLAKLGLRVLGLAYKILPTGSLSGGGETLKEELTNNPHSFIMTSLVGIVDPPRPDAIQAIKEAQQAGIIIKMITGDNPYTAVAVGKMLGLQNNKHESQHQAEPQQQEADEENPVDTTHENKELLAITGVELDAILASEATITVPPATTSPQTQTNQANQFQALVTSNNTYNLSFAEVVSKYDIFARTTPEHKLLIIKTLQSLGYICSMTGDGVNDSPALKIANIGVAMGITGTEVAKEASNMILLNDNFANIIDAICIGRNTYTNLIKILCFVLPTNFAQAFSITSALIIGTEIPITALQILWINMITSITLGLALAFEPIDHSVMLQKPRNSKKYIFGKFLIWRLFFVTILFVIIILGTFHWEQTTTITNNLNELRTIAVNTLTILQISYLFNCRSLRKPRFLKLFYGNKVIYIGIVSVIGLQAFFTYTPVMHYIFQTSSIHASAWAKICFWGFVSFIIIEMEKYFSYFYIHKHQRHEYHHHQQLSRSEEVEEEAI